MNESSLKAPYTAVESSPARLNRRQEAKQKTRLRVLESARSLFALHGYDSATIRDIASGAGMSTGAVFANFQDKADLFEAVLTEDMEETASAMRRGAEQARGDGLRAQIIAMFREGYVHGLERLPLVQATVARLWFQPVDAELRTRQIVREAMQVVSETLREGVRRGDLTEGADLKLLCETLWDLYLVNYRKAAYEGWSLSQIVTRLETQVDMVLAQGRA